MFDKTFAPMCTELSKPFNDTNKRYVASVIYDETAKIIYILPNWQAESRNKKNKSTLLFDWTNLLIDFMGW